MPKQIPVRHSNKKRSTKYTDIKATQIRRIGFKAGCQFFQSGVFPIIRKAAIAQIDTIVDVSSVNAEHSHKKTIREKDVLAAYQHFGKRYYPCN